MNQGARTYFAACAALCGFAVGYVLPVYAKLPRAIYDPLARNWSIANSVGAVPMGYVGQILWGIGGALAAFAVAVPITRRVREPSERGYGLWAAWALTALAIVLSWFIWNNWP